MPTRINDIRLKKWRKYPHILTEALWIIDKRNARYGSSQFHGNFVPDIPYQMMLRYTRRGESVLDPAAGSGTTGDVAADIGRVCHMVDLNPTRHSIGRQDLLDSQAWKFEKGMRPYDLIIFHPPYSDIIKYSDKPTDLSNVADSREFRVRFKQAMENLHPWLAPGRYFILVLGNIWEDGEEIPLGFLCSEQMRGRFDYKRRAVIVKNFGETQGGMYSPQQANLRRYRHLKNGTYDFAGDFIFVMQKPPEGGW